MAQDCEIVIEALTLAAQEDSVICEVTAQVEQAADENSEIAQLRQASAEISDPELASFTTT